MLYGFGGDASGGYGSGGEADGGVSEFGGFFSKPRANIYDLSRIFDKTADEARQVFNLAAKKSVNLLPETCIL